jgi:hypothetical protein
MLSNKELRRRKMLVFMRQLNPPTLERLAQHVGPSASYLSQIKTGHRPMSDQLARLMERQCHRPKGWMDEPEESFLDPDEQAMLACYRESREMARKAALEEKGKREAKKTRHKDKQR